MSSCSSVDKLETPAGIESSGKWLVIVNEDGVTRKLTLSNGVLMSDGVDVFFSQGGVPLPQPLLEALLNPTALNAVLGLDGSGNIYAMKEEGATRKYLSSLNGLIEFVEIDVIPDTGSGFVIRQPSEDVSFAESEGEYYVDNTGTVVRIPLGAEGTIRKISGGVPVYEAMGSGSAASGAGSIGLDGVFAIRTTSDQVDITIPKFTVADSGGTEVTYENINLTLDIDGGVGPQGTDDTLTDNKWYYIYIITDGNTPGIVSVVASQNGSAPDLSDPAFADAGDGDPYAFWGLCSVCRYRVAGSKIVKFIQQGRRFSTERQLILEDKSITSSWAYIPETKQSTTLFTEAIPPISKALSGIVGGSGNAAAGNVLRAMAVASTTDPIGEQYIGSKATGLDIPADGFRHDVGTFTDLVIADATNGDEIMAWRADASNSFRKLAVTGYII